MNTNMNETANVSEMVTEISTNENGEVMVQNVAAPNGMEPVKTRLERMLENIDTSSDVRKKLEAAQKRLFETEQAIVLLSQQLAEKAESDLQLHDKVHAMVQAQRDLGVDDDSIALVLQRVFSLTLPQANKPNAADATSPNANGTVSQAKTPEYIARKMGINVELSDQIVAWVASQKDGVGMKAIVEQFADFTNGDAQKFAGYVRSLYENGRLLRCGEKKASKYFAKTAQ